MSLLLISYPCSSDPYVKVWLVFGEKRVEKKKTMIYKCNLNPTFNQVTIKNITITILVTKDSYSILDL